MSKLKFIDPKKLWKKYVLAILLIFALVTFSHFVTIIVDGDGARTAKDINDSGRQRMLSQRILYYASSYRGSGYEDESHANRLRGALNEFRLVHNQLISEEERPLPPALKQIYFGKDGLDDLMHGFISASDAQYLDFPSLRDGTYFYMQDVGADHLLNQLNDAVHAFETHASQQDARAELYGYIGYALTVFALLFEAFVIFRPAQQIIVSAIEELQTSNDQLNSQEAEAFAALEEAEEAWIEASEAKSSAEEVTLKSRVALQNIRSEIQVPLDAIIRSLEQAAFGAGNDRHQKALVGAQKLSFLAKRIAEEIDVPDITFETNTPQPDQSFNVLEILDVAEIALPAICTSRPIKMALDIIGGPPPDVQGDPLTFMRLVLATLYQITEAGVSEIVTVRLEHSQKDTDISLSLSVRDPKLRSGLLAQGTISGTPITGWISQRVFDNLLDDVSGSVSMEESAKDGSELTLITNFKQMIKVAPPRRRQRKAANG
ncbi:MAG: type IV pili methyl-accepting chemotaxis transducer N-terminal domain-containing protein [Litoreibacter sp.]